MLKFDRHGVGGMLLSAAAFVLLPAWAARANPPRPETATMTTAPALDPAQDGRDEFDFLIGSWKVHLRKLLKPLTGSTEWIEYEGTSATRKIWDDHANTEEFDVESLDHEKRIHGQTLRLYNPASRQWSIYLVDAAKGVLAMPPVIGQFTDGRGEFYDQEIFDGRAIFVRYFWFNVSPTAARMEQSFSDDGGKSWEVNWICSLTR